MSCDKLLRELFSKIQTALSQYEDRPEAHLYFVLKVQELSERNPKGPSLCESLFMHLLAAVYVNLRSDRAELYRLHSDAIEVAAAELPNPDCPGLRELVLRRSEALSDRDKEVLAAAAKLLGEYTYLSGKAKERCTNEIVRALKRAVNEANQLLASR